MKQHLVLFGIFNMLLVCVLDGCIGPLATETVTSSYAAIPGTIVTISNFNGGVTITGWSDPMITVTAVKRSSVGQTDLKNIKVNATHTENHLDIKTIYSGPSTSQPSVDLTIKVPFDAMIDTVATSNGAIHVSSIKGDTVLSTSNGAIYVDHVTGFVSASTSNAYVEVKTTTGIIDVHTSNAAISTEVRAVRGDVSIDTSNAAITVYLSPLLNATVDAATSNAKVNVQGIALSTSLLQETHVIGTLGSDDHRIEIRTSNANIYLNGLQDVTS
jgi:hypothetical protein